MNNNGWEFFTSFGRGGRIFKVYARGGLGRIFNDAGKVIWEGTLPDDSPRERYRHAAEVYNSLENNET